MMERISIRSVVIVNAQVDQRLCSIGKTIANTKDYDHCMYIYTYMYIKDQIYDF